MLLLQQLMDSLFAVGEVHDDTIFPMEMLRQVLGAIDGAVLSAGASEGEHQVGESPLEVAFYVGIRQAVDRIEECQDLAVVFQETYYLLVQACQLLVRLVAAGVVGAAAVEDITAPVARRVLGDATAVGEGEDADEEGGRLSPRPPC